MTEKEMFQEVFRKNVVEKEALKASLLTKIHQREKEKRTIQHSIRYAGVVLACSFGLFVLALNTNTTFAKSMAEIPVVKYLAQMFTFVSYSQNEDFGALTLEQPEIRYPQDKELEHKINEIIVNQMTELAEIARKDAIEFKENYLAMGEDQVFTPIQITIDYDAYCVNDTILSFALNKTMDYGIYEFPFQQKFFYNFNLITGKLLTLEDCLGEDYKNKIDAQVEQQIIEKAKDDPNLLSFYNEFYKIHGGISEGQPFYLNQEGNVVVYFYEYTVAPGYAGAQEFVIK